ncbi:AAA family ATPase [Nonomuraea terrae]|uniref:AAA family ATPase n=1 Tax=Nonomuraea terrae TaxID=2530383 RepID=UPI0037A05717
MPARLTELRLTEFKTFRDAVLPIGDVTVLVGRNSSGKSNALDALDALSRLAEGRDVVDVLDGRRGDEGPLRGGIAGCPPHGGDEFEIGCTVINPDRAADDYCTAVDFDVRVRLSPKPKIVKEAMTGWYGSADSPRSGRNDLILTIEEVARESAAIILPALVKFINREQLQGDRPALTLSYAADDVFTALRGIFHLDPVPHLMRQYVPGHDTRIRRTAENLSAVIAEMCESAPAEFHELLRRTRSLVEHEITDIELVRSDLGDVMLALREGASITPAREMSDGLLRFMAVSTTLIGQGQNLDLGRRHLTSPTLVIEELENGLHPSQASQLLDLVKATTGAQVIFTTHSPALLSALAAEDHNHVIVSTRDRATGRSRLTRLPDIEGYPSLMAQGDLGSVVTSGALERSPKRGFTEFDRLMGIDQQ